MTSKSEKNLEQIGMERNIILKGTHRQFSALVEGQKEMNEHLWWVSLSIKIGYVMGGLSLLLFIFTVL